MNQELNKIKRKRKKLYSIIQIINLAIVILLVGTFLFIISDVLNRNFEIPFIIPFITILLATILISINQYLKRYLNKEISKAIYAPAFKEKNIEFSYEDGLTLDEVQSSHLLPKPDDFASDSLTKGEILGFPYKASNITLWREHEERDSKGNTRTTRTIIFDGRMYIIETPFNKKGIILKSKLIGKEKMLSNIIVIIVVLATTAIIVPNMLDILSDPFFKKSFKEDLFPFSTIFIVFILIIIVTYLSNRKKGYQRAKLESSQFNEYFKIQTQDQVELRKTLSPAVMEKLINLRNSIGEFHLSMIGNKIFFAFPKSFSVKYDKPIEELLKDAKEIVEKEIETIKTIIETLKLEEEKIKKGAIN
jgi:protein-S-isoprenylcysteine O-methyltransferase Ste14